MKKTETTTKATKTAAKTTTKTAKTTAKSVAKAETAAKKATTAKTTTKKAAPQKAKAAASRPARTATSRVMEFIARHGKVSKSQILDYYFNYVKPELRSEYKANPRRFRGFACFNESSSIFDPKANNGRYLYVESNGSKKNIYSVRHI